MKRSMAKWRIVFGGWILALGLGLLASRAGAQPLPCNPCPPACTNCPPFPTPPPPYSTPGLKLTIPVFTNGYIYTTVFEHDPTVGYDLYYKTNFNLTNWTAVLGNLAGLTNYWLTNSFTTDVFLLIASGLDSDGDGMPDGWELLHGFNPHSASDAAQDADGDGLTNLQEFQQGSDPKSAAAWTVFISTPRGTSALP